MVSAYADSIYAPWMIAGHTYYASSAHQPCLDRSTGKMSLLSSARRRFLREWNIAQSGRSLTLISNRRFRDKKG
ncbi:hypothetical protein N7540_010992 [Penicillium herquei]|nr:hypothetical protein N7540_010992 [Penicillium herquei]